MSFPIPPELLGLRPSWANPSGPGFGERIDEALKSRRDEGLKREELSEQQRMHRANEDIQQGELERGKAKDALMAKLADTKATQKMDAQSRALFQQAMIKATQAEALGDMAGAAQYRALAQTYVDGSQDTGPAPPEDQSNWGPKHPGFKGTPETPSRPFVDQGGLEFTQSPSGAFRTSKPSMSPPGENPSPEEGPGSLDIGPITVGPAKTPGEGSRILGLPAAPDAPNSGVSPDDVDSNAIASAFLGLPVSTKKKILTLADQVITDKAPGGGAAAGEGLPASLHEYDTPDAKPEEGGQWVRAPGGKSMHLAAGGRPDVQSVVSMWQSRIGSAQGPVEKEAAEAAAAAAGVSQNAQKAQDEGQKAYDSVLKKYKRQGASGGGGGGGAPDVKGERQDFKFDLDIAKDSEKEAKKAKGSMDDADRVLTLLDPGKLSGFKTRDALEAHLRSVTGSSRVSVQQLKMVLEGAGKLEEYKSAIDAWLNGGNMSPEYVRQMRDAAQVARDIARQQYEREVHAAEGFTDTAYADRPDAIRKRHIQAVHAKMTGETATPGNNSEPTKVDRAELERRANAIRQRLQGGQ